MIGNNILKNIDVKIAATTQLITIIIILSSSIILYINIVIYNRFINYQSCLFFN